MSIAKREDGRWRARYRDSGGKEHARHFERKADGARWLREQQGKVDRGDWRDPARGKVTVGEWSQRWLEGQLQLKPSTRQRYAGILRIQVDPTWKDVPLSSVGHAAVQKWVVGMSASGLAGSSVRQAHRVLSLILALAVRDQRISSNTAEGVKLPRAAKSDKQFLKADQVAQLADAAGHGHRTVAPAELAQRRLVILCLAYTGLRFGELAALRARRVDLMRRRLDIAESVTEVNGLCVFTDTKNHQQRSVPFPKFLTDDLTTLLAGKGPEDLAFTAPEGGVLRLMGFRRRVFDRATKAAGLPGLTPHELRHTAASLAIASGANVKDVQRMLGHASAAMTLDVYAGLFEDGLDDVADRMDGLGRAAAQVAADSLRTGGQIVPIRSDTA
jgi:integrase